MNVPCSKLQLFFRAEKLADMDTTSKSDPYCVVMHDTRGANGATNKNTKKGKGTSGHPNVLGRTETVKNDLSPKFGTGVPVDFFFEEQQKFTLMVMDDDKKGIDGDETLGVAHFQLAQVVGSRNATLELKLATGRVFVTAKEASGAGEDTVDIQFKGFHLKKMDTFGKSDPYYKFYRVLPNGNRVLIQQSKVIPKTLDPQWLPVPTKRIADLTTADFNDQTFRFECFDEDMTSDDPMGCFQFSFTELMAKKQSGESFFLKSEENQELFGEVKVAACRITEKPTFFKLLRQGMTVSLAASIDFTGSNGNPTSRESLHFMNPDPQQPNQYVRAFTSVGEVLMEYDSDKQVPAFGFGAKLPDGSISHCFNLNFQQNPHVEGIRGIYDAYGAAIQQVQLYGPTNFAPTITTVTAAALSAAHNYTILLILTDGAITDMSQTVDAIVAAADAPMSIIIVGVGNADFSMMDQLDGDDNALRASNGRVCKRDIVQFVPFSKYMNAPPGRLAAEVLREVPGQVEKWASMTGYMPPQ